MGLMTTAIIGLSAMQAASSLSSGIAASREAQYNAGVLEAQAKELDIKSSQVDIQKGIEASQYDRAIRRMGSTLTARTAKSGLTFSGSPLSVLLDTQTQMELDKSIGQYSFDIQKYDIQAQKSYALSGADLYRQRSKVAMASGLSGMFTSLLQGGVNYGIYKAQSKPKATGA